MIISAMAETAIEPIKNKEGRPEKTPEEITQEKEIIVRKLEPYLKTGLSINKALGQAHVSRHIFYEYMRKDEEFRDKINDFRHFMPILLNNIITGELMEISAKQNPAKGKAKMKLSKEDKAFIWKYALYSNLTKDEFGERKKVELFDPEAEVQKVKSLMDDDSSEDIEHEDDPDILT